MACERGQSAGSAAAAFLVRGLGDKLVGVLGCQPRQLRARFVSAAPYQERRADGRGSTNGRRHPGPGWRPRSVANQFRTGFSGRGQGQIAANGSKTCRRFVVSELLECFSAAPTIEAIVTFIWLYNCFLVSLGRVLFREAAELCVRIKERAGLGLGNGECGKWSRILILLIRVFTASPYHFVALI